MRSFQQQIWTEWMNSICLDDPYYHGYYDESHQQNKRCPVWESAKRQRTENGGNEKKSIYSSRQLNDQFNEILLIWEKTICSLHSSRSTLECNNVCFHLLPFYGFESSYDRSHSPHQFDGRRWKMYRKIHPHGFGSAFCALRQYKKRTGWWSQSLTIDYSVLSYWMRRAADRIALSIKSEITNFR